MIAFIAPNGLDAGLLERLWVVPLAGGGPLCLTPSFDQAVNDSVINDMRAGHATRVTWSAGGDRIYFPASGSGVTSIQSVDLDGNLREEAGGQRRIYDFDVAKGTLVFCASDPTHPGELYMLTQGAEARVTDMNPWLHERYVAQPEQEYFTAPDGWKLEGWVLKPPGFDPSRLHPTVMEIHGGPHAQYGWSFFHELQILAGMGYVVFYMNPRGSDGYGERFRRDVVRDWAGKDYLDLMASLDQIIERTGYIDANRLGVGGGSYGGYMTNWIIGQTNRFSAAVSMRSISNLVSEYPQHDIVLWGVLQLGPPPWPNLDELWRRSPIRYVQNMKTPLLLTAGEMDLRCAISQSEEMFGAMRLLGKTVELLRFPEESHDLSRNGRPDRRVERLRRIAGWYERFLGTAATDRVVEEATQVLPVPSFVTREEPAQVQHPEAPAAEAEAAQEETETLVLETVAAAEAVSAAEPAATAEPMVGLSGPDPEVTEPEALPDLPEPADEYDLAPESEELAPALQVAAAEAEPKVLQEAEPAIGGEPDLEPVHPADEPELESFAESEPEPAAAEGQVPTAEPEPETAVESEPEPLPEPEPEPVLESGPEPVLESEPEPAPM